MPSTTLNVISIKINDELNLLDTPGLINDGNITVHLSESAIKDSNIKDEINPRIYQNKEICSLALTDIGRIDCLNPSNISIYISNNVDINKINFENDKYKDLELTKIKINSEEDLVIEGLCFIKCSSDTSFDIYMPKGTDIYNRDKII
jgi:ribosome biogenesis GTPase A